MKLWLAAIPIRDIRLSDASDCDIFFKARLGNSSNAALQAVLSTTLTKAIELLQDGETWGEIRQSSHGN